jgi:hypothetical protein
MDQRSQIAGAGACFWKLSQGNFLGTYVLHAKLIDRGEHEDEVGKTNDKTNPQLDEGCSPNYASK